MDGSVPPHPTMSEPVTQVTRGDLTEAVRVTALLADLTISMWSGERTDKKISAKLKEDAHAVGNTGRYIKNLLAGSDTLLRETRAAFAAGRARHYELTLPWVSNPHADRVLGPRLLPNALTLRYMKEMSALKRDAEGILARFLGEYPDLIVQAQANLAGLADPADYPTTDEVRSAFRLSFDFQPIPDSGSFQNLPDWLLDKLSSQLQGRQQRAVAASQTALWERVREAVSHLIGRLEDPDTRFKASTVETVRELITLLPGFNCVGDDRVNDVAADIDRMLTGVDADTIRKNDSVRRDVVARAQAITGKLDQWGL